MNNRAMENKALGRKFEEAFPDLSAEDQMYQRIYNLLQREVISSYHNGFSRGYSAGLDVSLTDAMHQIQEFNEKNNSK